MSQSRAVRHVSFGKKKISIVVRARCVYCMHPPMDRRENTDKIFKKNYLFLAVSPLYDALSMGYIYTHTYITDTHAYTRYIVTQIRQH